MLFISISSKAQVTFGLYSQEELALEIVPFEVEAKQVILYEEANSYFKVNGIFTDYIFRIKVLDDNAEGFGDFRITFYKGINTTEDITKLKAQVSYLEGEQRKVLELLNKTHIKEVDLGEGYFEIRIAFPHVRKGSILEYRYTKMNKSYSILEGWAFQAELPALVSKYTFKAPDFFQYQMITQGKALQEVAEISSKRNTYSWTLKNIPSLPQESFVGSLYDYQIRVDGYLFTSQYVKEENLESSDIFYASWNQMSTKLRENFETSTYLGDKFPKAKYPAEIFKDSTQHATSVNVFNYVSKNYKAYSSRWLEPFYTLTEFLDKKEGNSFDKNLLLSHLLKLEGIDSYIVMVNERGNGRSTLIEKPYINQFKSSILLANIDGQQMYLDASDSITPFGLVPLRKLVSNGFFMEKDKGRLDEIIVPHRSGVVQMVNLELDSTQNLQLSHTLRYMDYEALKAGEFIDQSSYEKSLKENNEGIKLLDFSLVNQIKDKRMLTMRFKTSIEDDPNELIAINPFKFSSFSTNPFTQESRILPIDFDYPVFETFTVNLTIPDGYELDDFPENEIITIPSKGIKFTFQSSVSNKELKISSRVEVIQSTFPATEYADLKFIMESIASKLLEPILLKRL